MANRKSGKPMSLELLQRDFLGIIDEPMEFSEASIARCLETVAETVDADEVFFLRGVIRALSHPESEWRLKLVRRKRGKFVPPDEHGEAHDRKMGALYAVAMLEHEGMKSEAAVATIARQMNASRATIFSWLGEAEEFLKIGRQLSPESDKFRNPRPDKTRKD